VRPNGRAASTRHPAVGAILTENWGKQGFLLNPAVSVLNPFLSGLRTGLSELRK
jgi:hypothetical protein